MKIKLRELRRIIRESIDVGKDLAALVDEVSNGFKATVYDPVRLEDLVLDSPEILSDGPTTLKSCIIGRIHVTEPEGPCWGAMKVASIAGPGELMYSIGYALSPSGLLISEREPEAMTTDAISAWRRMAAKKDRNKKELDDIADPQTPPTEDDCDLRPEEFLNYAYEAKGGETAMLRSMQDEHERLMTRLTTDGKLSRLMIELAISSAGFSYFQTRYSAALRRGYSRP